MVVIIASTTAVYDIYSCEGLYAETSGDDTNRTVVTHNNLTFFCEQDVL